ncbi:ACP S-malonyltransferase [Sphingorhabdus arenilitoris]|uniref:[acyl-carrier-protein] S-malonyltransferase n=1 Tax=Sphingorhabdus arenilitoris TaxID=1490041 RepID=A0ABV8RFB9_9SPHN
MKKTALVICPGRGSYNATDLGYLRKYHGGGGDIVARCDALRRQMDQVTISDLDSADKFSPSLHMTGDNASLLIYACAMADFAAIDRDAYDIVAVTGNSMGWYLSLACAGMLSFKAGARLVNNMGTLMHHHGAGGQVIWSMADEDWRIDPAKQDLASQLLAAAKDKGLLLCVSIRLGAMIVFAGEEAALRWLIEQLPTDGRFPMRLGHHAAFHSPLLNAIIPMAQATNPQDDFGIGTLPAVDGEGRIWTPAAFAVEALYAYTLGRQINQTYDFTRAVQVAVREYMPEKIIITGPGTTMGAPTMQALIAIGWRGLSSKKIFLAAQQEDPVILSMAMEDQRHIATGH